MELEVNLIIGVNVIFETSRAEGYGCFTTFLMPSWNFYTADLPPVLNFRYCKYLNPLVLNVNIWYGGTEVQRYFRCFLGYRYGQMKTRKLAIETPPLLPCHAAKLHPH